MSLKQLVATPNMKFAKDSVRGPTDPAIPAEVHCFIVPVSNAEVGTWLDWCSGFECQDDVQGNASSRNTRACSELVLLATI